MKKWINNMQKGQVLIFLLVGILVFMIAGGAFYLGRQTISKPSPNPVITPKASQATPASSASPAPNSTDETANWKTYTNSKYGFSFKYPSQWYVAEQDESGTVFINSAPIPNIPLTHGLSSGIQISIDFSQTEHNYPWKYSSSVVSMGGVQGTKLVDQEPGRDDELMRTRIILSKGNINYWIVFVNSDAHGTHNPIFNQILSTFKFTQ